MAAAAAARGTGGADLARDGKGAGTGVGPSCHRGVACTGATAVGTTAGKTGRGKGGRVAARRERSGAAASRTTRVLDSPPGPTVCASKWLAA